MGRIFISTLGAGRYEACRYSFDDAGERFVSPGTKYIQEASIRSFCKGWSSDQGDRIRILCTDRAREQHWQGADGLESCLEELFKEQDYQGLSLEDSMVSIPEGQNEQEIWGIFEELYKQFNPNDVVRFDITHAFRSIPMLVLVAIPYAKLLKNVKVCSISYGAFDKKIDDIAPVFDLTPFAQLMDWTNAAKDFVDYGQTGELKTLFDQKTKEVTKASKGKNESVRLLSGISRNMATFSRQINENRLKDIISFNELHNYLKEFESIDAVAEELPKAFLPIIAKIDEKIAAFKKDDLGNVFAAARWCEKHGMYQNAYSILLEGVVSIALNLCRVDDKASAERDLVTVVCRTIAGSIKREEHKPWVKNYDDLYDELEKLFDMNVAVQIDKLCKRRNAFMHAGTGKDSIPEKRDVYSSELPEYIGILESWYKERVQ